MNGAPFLSRKRTHVVQRQVATAHGALCAAHLTLDRQHSRTGTTGSTVAQDHDGCNG